MKTLFIIQTKKGKIVKWHFMENKREIMQNVLKMQ